LLLHQFLAEALQITVLLHLRLGYADKRQQTPGIELRQLRRIDSIGLDLFAAWMTDTRRRHHVTVIVFVGEIPLQGITDIRCFLAQPQLAPWEPFADFLKLVDYRLQDRPAIESKDFAGLFIQCRAVELRVVDIKADVD